MESTYQDLANQNMQEMLKLLQIVSGIAGFAIITLGICSVAWGLLHLVLSDHPRDQTTQQRRIKNGIIQLVMGIFLVAIPQNIGHLWNVISKLFQGNISGAILTVIAGSLTWGVLIWLLGSPIRRNTIPPEPPFIPKSTVTPIVESKTKTKEKNDMSRNTRKITTSKGTGINLEKK